MIRSFLVTASAVLLTACSAPDSSTLSAVADEPQAAPDATMPVQDPVMAALRAPERPEADRQDDAKRHVKEVLWFMDLQPGDIVFEMEAGGGYYTEILSRVVGPDGQVVMQNPAYFDAFIIRGDEDGYETRLGGDRLPNVRLSKSDFDALDAEDGSVDVVTWILGPHELWYEPADNVSFGDPATSFAEIARILKPGGEFIAIDHAAAPGSTPEDWASLHRITPQQVRNMAEAAGLEFVESSDILANTDDDHTLNVFDDKVRRKTDRFIFKFRKPE